MLGVMRPRLLWAGVLGSIGAALALWLWLRQPAASPASPAAQAGGQTVTGAAVTGAGPRADRLRPGPRRPRQPATDTSPPGTFTVGGTTIAGLGVYDPEAPEVQANLLEFKKSRLRFALYDAAAECWSGGDEVADIQVSYTLIVENETLRLENVRMTESTLPDPAVEQCILGRLRELRSAAADIPDQREDGASWIALHDLHKRNRRQP